MLKYKYGMHPLTVTWPPILYTDYGYRTSGTGSRSAGSTTSRFKPNGRVHQLLTRLAIENLLHPFQTFILGQKNLAPKIAAQVRHPADLLRRERSRVRQPDRRQRHIAARQVLLRDEGPVGKSTWPAFQSRN